MVFIWSALILIIVVILILELGSTQSKIELNESKREFESQFKSWQGGQKSYEDICKRAEAAMRKDLEESIEINQQQEEDRESRARMSMNEFLKNFGLTPDERKAASAFGIDEGEYLRAIQQQESRKFNSTHYDPETDSMRYEGSSSQQEKFESYFGGYPGNRGAPFGYSPSYREQSYTSSETTIPTHLKEAYDVLGVSVSADSKDIKKAYRKLISKNHPDRFSSSGVNEDKVKAANEKTRKIIEAYDLIKSSRGFK